MRRRDGEDVKKCLINVAVTAAAEDVEVLLASSNAAFATAFSASGAELCRVKTVTE